MAECYSSVLSGVAADTSETRGSLSVGTDVPKRLPDSNPISSKQDTPGHHMVERSTCRAQEDILSYPTDAKER